MLTWEIRPLSRLLSDGWYSLKPRPGNLDVSPISLPALLLKAVQYVNCVPHLGQVVGLTHLAQALVEAGIYSEDEVKQNNGAIWDSLGTYSSGYITFT
jgi:hypothetical protein